MVDGYAEENAAILSRLDEMWEEDAPIAWPNVAFTPPAGGPWVEVALIRQEAFNRSITSADKLVRHPGLLSFTVRAPLNAGDGTALRLADALCEIFRNVTFDRIAFRAPTVRPAGVVQGKYVVQVDCPFWRDSILPDV